VNEFLISIKKAPFKIREEFQLQFTCARRVPCPLGASKTSPCQASLKPTTSISPSSTKGGVKPL